MIVVILIVLFAIAAPAQAASGTLLFDEEFNGVALSAPSDQWNSKNYTAQSGTEFAGWNQITEDGLGHLLITAKRTSSGSYRSGFLTTKPTFAPTPPLYYEVRAKVAHGYGTWSSPAWSWKNPYGGAPGEVDAVEQLGREPAIAHETIHYGPGQAGYAYNAGVDLSLHYHTYGAAIYPDRIEFYVDGKLTVTRYASSYSAWPFVQPTTFNCSLNMGGWGGIPTVKRAVMKVDWYRVYGG